MIFAEKKKPLTNHRQRLSHYSSSEAEDSDCSS